jgi:Colicin V production protein/Trypsin-like peptidase domain
VLPGALTLVDVVVFLLAAAAAARGWHRGLLGQAFELGGGFIGLVAGVALGPRLASAVTNDAGLDAALLALVVVLVGLSLGQGVGFALGHRFGSFARRARLGVADSLLGAGFGILMTLVAYWLLGSLLVSGPYPPLSRELSRSPVLRALNDVTRPPDVLAYIQQYLNTSGFPLVDRGLPSGASPPASLPPRGRARRASLAGSKSTVRVVVPGCGGQQLGSGWLASSHTVVTNAHVVAGGTSVRVEDTANRSYSGYVVLFDPVTDVAVVHTAEAVSAPPLELRRAPLGAGAQGVTIGYPGRAGGRQRVRRAAVRTVFQARGYDIYGRSPARRDVYALRAHVLEGDSGGPFVLPSGKVAGVVFAASTTESDTGYALTAGEVADEVARGVRATRPVTTGRCTH